MCGDGAAFAVWYQRPPLLLNTSVLSINTFGGSGIKKMKIMILTCCVGSCLGLYWQYQQAWSQSTSSYCKNSSSSHSCTAASAVTQTQSWWRAWNSMSSWRCWNTSWTSLRTCCEGMCWATEERPANIVCRAVGWGHQVWRSEDHEDHVVMALCSALQPQSLLSDKLLPLCSSEDIEIQFHKDPISVLDSWHHSDVVIALPGIYIVSSSIFFPDSITVDGFGLPDDVALPWERHLGLTLRYLKLQKHDNLIVYLWDLRWISLHRADIILALLQWRTNLRSWLTSPDYPDSTSIQYCSRWGHCSQLVLFLS